MLTNIAQLVESQAEGMFCTIWLPNEDEKYLDCVASPSLPGFSANVGRTAIQRGSSPKSLVSGQFYSILHPTAGTATIYEMGDGTHVLRLTNFSTSNGPDVHVYMVAADDAKEVAAVERAGFIDLGVIKGNVGDQNYTLGTDLDLAKYRAVSIWCKRFSVNFGAAALRPT